MRFARALGISMLLALSIGDAAADDHAIVVTPAQAVLSAGASRAYVTVSAPDAPAVMRPRASLIVYGPDGRMLRKPQSKRLSDSRAMFRVLLGAAPLPGTYTLFATTEVGTQAFGMPATFEVAPN
jgi:hypothetical protein